jgi:uncharacterized protein with PQ loop repeat
MNPVSWLINRMQWVYGFVVNDLGLPSQVGYAVLGLLVIIFFYDLFHIYKRRNTGDIALVWLAVLLIVPLGTLIYLFFGRPMLNKLPIRPTLPTVRSKNPLPLPGKKTTTTLGSIVGVIAIVAGAVGLFFFVMVIIALVQCANDPKCM